MLRVLIDLLDRGSCNIRVRLKVGHITLLDRNIFLFSGLTMALEVSDEGEAASK